MSEQQLQPQIPQFSPLFTLTEKDWYEIIGMVWEIMDGECGPVTTSQKNYLDSLTTDQVYKEMIKRKSAEELRNEPWDSKDEYIDYFQECVNSTCIEMMEKADLELFEENDLDYTYERTHSPCQHCGGEDCACCEYARGW